MAMRILLPVFVLLIFTSCSVKRLPFYNSSSFTPEWISEKDPSFDSIHIISNFNLINQNGKDFSQKDLNGNIYIADFFFTTCPGICPVMTKNMKLIHDKFLKNGNLKLLSFTVNPTTDNSDKLKEYSDKLGVSSDKWIFLTGSKNDIYTIARKSFFADDDTGLPIGETDFIHTEKFLLVDNRNRIRGVYNGTSDEEISKLEEDIIILEKEIDG